MTAQPDGIHTAPAHASRKAALGKDDLVVHTEQLVKTYGRIEALKGVSLDVRRGEVFGLLGQNGAGKTTMVKILLGITKLTAGHAELFGEAAGTVRVRRLVGYLPEDHRFPDYHTASSLLDFYGNLLEVPRADRRRRTAELLDLVGLKGRKDYKIRTYSKGMKQRLGIAQTLINDPELLFLDEPTDGVDPVGRKEIRALLHRLKEEGKTIFLNSHLLGEVELICDRVIIMQRGEIVREGNIAALTEQRGYYTIGIAPREELPCEELAKIGYSARRDGELWEIGLKDGQSIDVVVDLLHARGLHLRHLAEKRQSLEDLFIQTVEAAEPGIDQPVRRQKSKV